VLRALQTNVARVYFVSYAKGCFTRSDTARRVEKIEEVLPNLSVFNSKLHIRWTPFCNQQFSISLGLIFSGGYWIMIPWWFHHRKQRQPHVTAITLDSLKRSRTAASSVEWSGQTANVH